MQKILTRLFITALLIYSTQSKSQSAFSLLRTGAHPKSNHIADSPEYSRVKIWMDGKSATELANLGIDLSEGDYRKGVWFTSDFNAHTISKINHAGFRTEILIDDVKAFYKNRIESSARNVVPVNSQTVACGTPAPAYPAPSHFYHGSMGGFFTYAQLLGILDSMTLLYPNLITIK